MMRLVNIFLLPFAVYAGSISGTVYLKIGKTQKPCARAEVAARAASDPQAMQSSVTDAQGHYTLRSIEGRVSLSVTLPGYLSRAVEGGGRTLAMDVARDERLDNADFELLPGGVITGRITDQQGIPMDGVLVSVSRVSHSKIPPPSPTTAKTDDRGIYRAFGLDPGRYLVFARPAQWVGPDRPAGIYYRDTGDPARADFVEAVAGGETSGIA